MIKFIKELFCVHDWRHIWFGDNKTNYGGSICKKCNKVSIRFKVGEDLK